ncbi:lysoplasmalogenase [Winogradskyella sp. A2]|uniref:lysoplasmalogenase n=1 Tax=Winogradskyella sp. A2 TaxID=3366944 RepID=UPI00398C374D
MLTYTERQFTILFLIIVLFELITGSVPELTYAHYIAKPAIVVSLIVLFFNSCRNLPPSIRKVTILALGFSVLGDILLMFVEQNAHFFTFGLIAFLIAHVLYIIVFLKHRNQKSSPLGFIALLLLYASGLFYLLRDGLGEMLIPVFIYMIVILSMATTAYLRKNMVPQISYVLVFVGAILFLVSDSALAINKFYAELPLSNIIVMLTYALAQYFIVLGILKINVTNT